MKKMYLIYNPLLEEYYLDCGSFKHRKYLGNVDFNEIIKQIRGNVDFKRKTDFCLNKDLPEKLKNSIKELFKETKINVIDLD